MKPQLVDLIFVFKFSFSVSVSRTKATQVRFRKKICHVCIYMVNCLIDAHVLCVLEKNAKALLCVKYNACGSRLWTHKG